MVWGVIFLVATGSFMLVCLVVEFWGGNATGPNTADLPCSGFGHGEAARTGGEPRNDSLCNGPYGDWPFVPADLKIRVHHGRKG